MEHLHAMTVHRPVSLLLDTDLNSQIRIKMTRTNLRLGKKNTSQTRNWKSLLPAESYIIRVNRQRSTENLTTPGKKKTKQNTQDEPQTLSQVEMCINTA